MQVTENRDERQSPCLQDILCYVWEMVERKPRTEKALCKMKIYIQKTEQLEDNTTKIGKIVSHTDISSHLKYWHILSTQEINNEYLLLPRLWLGNGDRMVRLRFKMRIISSEFAKKGLYSQSYGFSRSHILMWELDHKESWAPRNWCFWTVVLEKTLESPLDCKEIKPVHPKGNQSWVFIGWTDADAEAEAPILWPPDMKSQLIRKDPGAGKDWRQEEKGMTGDKMVGWHHRLNRHEFEQALGVGNGQGSLACCSP